MFAWFQYIPCYCLSLLPFVQVPPSSHFNTSHVTVYHKARPCTMCHTMISIHPMLLFIAMPAIFSALFSGFQYIPCYCLSQLAVPVLKSGAHFNTSHVTIYLVHNPHTGYPNSFQYIPCYCLSPLSHTFLLLYRYFNTSHVTVYQNWREYNKQDN